MIVLALNCGSSSVRAGLFDGPSGGPAGAAPRPLVRAAVEGVTAGSGTLTLHREAEVVREPVPGEGHDGAVRRLLARLTEPRSNLPRAAVVGHRVVHGGPRFTQPTRIDAEVLRAIEGLEELAPLHNAPSLVGIRVARAALGPDVPMVAVFDTAFHAALPERASSYAIPRDLAERHGIRRFGFHGLSYQSVLARYCQLTGTPPDRATLVALHLGSGCSAAAIRAGRSVDTSMGLTPLEGLVMGTRCGDLDPGVPGYLARREGVSLETVEGWLNTRSGLLGLSGLSQDMRVLLDREAEHPGARLALDAFCYRARKYVGAYLAALGGARALIFTGAIGQSAPRIRARICEGLAWCGAALDPALNAATVTGEGCISRDDAPLPVYVIPADEERVIAHETARCVTETTG